MLRLNFLAIMLALLGAAIWPTSAPAMPLAEISLQTSGGTGVGVSAIRSTFSVGLGDWIIEPLAPSNHSRTFQATRATASHFALLEWELIVSTLTNGRDDDIGWKLGPAFTLGGGRVGSEESFFFNLNGPNPEGDITATTFVPLLNGIDLAGYRIRRISMRLDELSLNNGEGDPFASWAGTATFTIHGSVPEPNSVVLLALSLGLVGVLFRPSTRQ